MYRQSEDCPRRHACSLSDGFCILAVGGEVQILVALLDIAEVLVIVNIVGVGIGLGCFLLLALGLHQEEGTAADTGDQQNAHQREQVRLFLFLRLGCDHHRLRLGHFGDGLGGFGAFDILGGFLLVHQLEQVSFIHLIQQVNRFVAVGVTVDDDTFSDPGACLENAEYLPDRGLKQEEVLRFGICNYIQEHHNNILLGATDSGKTYLACALGMAAARRFYAVKYIRLPDLLVEFQIARGNGTIRKLMAQDKKYALLIIDEWLLYPLNETGARDLLDIVESRYKPQSHR